MTLREFVDTLYQGSAKQGFVEIRAFDEGGKLWRGWQPYPCSPENSNSFTTKQVPLTHRDKVYYGVALRGEKGDRKGIGGKENCVAGPVLYAELDLKDEEHAELLGEVAQEMSTGERAALLLGMTAEALAEVKARLLAWALARCDELSLPLRMAVDSGHGLHLYWTRQSSSSNEDTERYLKALIEPMRADRVSAELARVLRPPGTFNTKNPERHLPVDVVYLDSAAYVERDALEALIKPEPARTAPTGTPMKPTDNSKPTSGEKWAERAAKRRRAEVAAAVSGEARIMAGTMEGGRNNQLNVSAMKLARFLPHGELDEGELVETLVSAARAAGEEEGKIMPTIRSGISKGTQDPADPERFDQEEREKAEKGVKIGKGRALVDGGELPDGNFKELPIVKTNGSQLRQQTAATLAALLSANRAAPRLFLRAGELIRINDGEERAELQPLQVADMISEMTDAADFISIKIIKDGEVIETHVRPPVQIAQDVLSRRNKTAWPRLELLAPAPLFDQAGSLVTSNGYHVSSGIYLHGALKLPELPSAGAALALLDEVFADFIFHDWNAARAHILAALLTVPTRLLFDGPAPLILINGAQQGTGKSLLAEVVSMIATGGGRISTSSFPSRPEEQEKTITARLYADEPVILLDNVMHLGGEVLASALTSATWSGRYLGRSQMLTLTNKALWLATGNNPRLDNEMPRRIVPVRLTADRVRPEDRTDFRHPDLKRWARQELPRIYAAVLALVINWQQQGSVRYSARRLGGYEDWAEIIGGILASAGVNGFLTDREDIYQTAADGELIEWAQLLEHLDSLKGHEYQWRVKEMVPHVEALGLLEDITGDAKTEHSKARRLASALRAQRDRVVGKHQLRMEADKSNNSKVWRVLPAGDAIQI